LRIGDLIKITGVTRETIHYYTREGLLPKPHKTSRNQAEYNEEHVKRIRMIKELQDKLFLPLSTIKKIIKKQKKSKDPESLLNIKTEYFYPVDQLLPKEIIGEESFLKLTGMSSERLKDFEGWGIINPTQTENRKVYSNDDLKIGKLIGDMRRTGLSYEKGFKYDGLKDFRDQFMKIVNHAEKIYFDATLGKMTKEEMVKLSDVYIELLAIFFYHLSHILLKNSITNRLQFLKDELEGSKSGFENGKR
jgi:DNA-binding transcriptional MerR regulator